MSSRRPAWVIVAVLAAALLAAQTATARPPAAALGHFALDDVAVGRSPVELQAQLRHSRDVLHFFHHHRWMLDPRVGSCAGVPFWADRRRCEIARRDVTAHRWLARVASRRLASARAAASPLAGQPRWLVDAFACIHHYEGAWDDSPSNTSSVYWGGLQFGSGEWRTYGGQYAATADLATPAEQIAAGIAYWHVSGFAPWPNTARDCHLL